jgi:hypothetical protein
MDPITLNLRVGRLPAASAPGPGEMSAEEIDANFAALRTAADQLDAEKLGIADATPITAAITTLLGSDQLVVLRGGVPYTTTLAAVQTFVGGVPSATAPAAFTAGQWTATAGTELIELNITALAADGGSAITALQYRLGTGAAVTMTGTGTGIRQITGLTGATAYDVQIRAVNAIGAGEWSDTKTRTPAEAPVGSGDAAYVGYSEFSTGPFEGEITVSAPAGTASTDTLVVLCLTGDSENTVATMPPPAGWTNLFSGSAAGGDGPNHAWSAFSAPASVAALTFVAARLRQAHVIAVTGGVVAAAGAARYWGDGGQLHTAPGVTAADGDLVVSLAFQLDGALTAATDPQAGFTRQFLTAGEDPPRASVVSGVVGAGDTGAIQHNAGLSDWNTRAFMTLAVR